MSVAYVINAALYVLHYDKDKIVYRAWWFVMIASSFGQIIGADVMNYILLQAGIKVLFLICSFIILIATIVINFVQARKKLQKYKCSTRYSAIYILYAIHF